MNVSATDVKNRFGEVMEQARREPVTITKTGRPSAVLLDIAEYQRLRRLENDHWGRLAQEAEKSGYIGTEATMALLTAGAAADSE